MTEPIRILTVEKDGGDGLIYNVFGRNIGRIRCGGTAGTQTPA